MWVYGSDPTIRFDYRVDRFGATKVTRNIATARPDGNTRWALFKVI